MNRVVLITGASSGIGYESAKQFKKNQDIILNISRTNCNIADENFCCDLNNYEKLTEIFEKIAKKYAKIDILVNNAGFGMSGITELLNFNECKSLFDVNFFGKLFCVQKALPFMQKGGKILNISSAMALMPVPYRGIYGASKSAVLNFSLSLRMELEPLNIEVVTICPGNTKSGFTTNRLKNFKTNERYGNRQQKATEKIDKGDNKRMPSSFVAKKIFKISTKKKNKPMLVIGTKYKFLYLLSKTFPKSWFLYFTRKKLGG